MSIKLTALGLLLYLAICAYLAALISAAFRRDKPRNCFYAAGFVIIVIAITLRWMQVRHLPMQSIFEIFLWLGALMFPISLLCRRFLDIEGLSLDIAIAVCLLFPAAFVFDHNIQPLPPALQSWMFGPHVGAYMLSYVLLFKASASAGHFIYARIQKKGPCLKFEQDAYKLLCLGYPLLTLGLVLGCFWAKIAWSNYWSWDPKELWSLATWLTFAAAFHHRSFNSRQKPATFSFLVLLGGIFVIITLVWVNLSRIFAGMHNYA